jgi:hypothetical protein
MISRYIEKNKYGGYTWLVKFNNEFFIEINSSDVSTFIVEFKEAKWIRYKTIFTIISKDRLFETIKMACHKMLGHMQGLSRYDIDNKAVEGITRQVLSEIVNSPDLIDIEYINYTSADSIIFGMFPIKGMSLSCYSIFGTEVEDSGEKMVTGCIQITPDKIILTENDDEVSYEISDQPMFSEQSNIHNQTYIQVDILATLNDVEYIFKLFILNGRLGETVRIAQTKPCNGELSFLTLTLGI